MSFQDQLGKINADLSRVALRVKGDRLYLRGTFPPKPGHDKPQQYEIATGYRAVSKELRLAEALAQEVEGLLIREKFSWVPYLKGNQKPSETIGEWLARFESDRWQRIEKDSGSLNTWVKSYLNYFEKLPKDKPISIEVLKQTIEDSTRPAKRSRQLACMAYSALAKYAGLDPTDLKGLAKGYKRKAITSDDVPTDADIEAAILGIPNPSWRWAFGMVATFGIRNHEIFRLSCDRIAEGIVRVSDQNKTRSTRLVWACPMQWLERFDLTNISVPICKGDHSNKYLGARVSHMANNYKLPFTAYNLRDSYALRLAVEGVDVAIAARWMGHSVTVHCEHYLDALQERHSQEVFDRINSVINSPHSQESLR